MVQATAVGVCLPSKQGLDITIKVAKRQRGLRKHALFSLSLSLLPSYCLVPHCSYEMKMLATWKESYDQLRQHIKKQRHYFANKGPYSQGYDFSNSHLQM